MEFDLSVEQINALIGYCGPDSPLAERMAAFTLTNGRILLPDSILDDGMLDFLADLAEKEGDRALKFQVIALRNIRRDKDDYPAPENIEDCMRALVNYFGTDPIDGWIYKRNKDGALLPWLIDDITFVPRDEALMTLPYVSIDLIANTMAATVAPESNSNNPEQWRSGMTNSIVFYPRDMNRLSVPELLGRRGFYKECPAFKEEYDRHEKLFRDYQPFYGKQFVATHSGFLIREGTTKLFKDLEYFRILKGTNVKCINDEEIIERRIETHTNKRTIANLPGRIPLHCYLHMFHLELHENCWVHVQNLEEYRYKPELKDKLILPAEHRRLIDILTAHTDVLMDDIIEGKSGGTTILCMGAAGLGKTLTAEVYSEVAGKPLYRVHSGQLGITADTVEAALSGILQRASRWDSILLLDEADVYIRQRDNDLQHNAIVAEFLRTLEYFNGLLFMTTNRVDDVDDAILSRCIAVVRYELPPKEDAIKLWKSLSEQFGVQLSDKMIDDLVREFPNSSGRDIKELLKLTSRLCLSCCEPISLEAFHQCAVFRGRKVF